jgi:hypothetical protein
VASAQADVQMKRIQFLQRSARKPLAPIRRLGRLFVAVQNAVRADSEQFFSLFSDFFPF